MIQKHWFFIAPFSFIILLATFLAASTTQAQAEGQNPTPIVIILTPEASPTAVATATAEGSLPPDRFEPNNDASTATVIGLQTEVDLTLSGDDVDGFTGYLKAGQMVSLQTTVYEGLDTRLSLFWEGQLRVENDDRSLTDVGSLLVFTAPTDGWYVVVAEKVTVYNGRYDLTVSLVEPTATATPLPTATAAPTSTPLPTATFMPSPTPLMPPDLAELNDSPETARPITPGQHNAYGLTPDPLLVISDTITTTGHISVTVQHLGRVEPQTTTPTTSIRLLVYYDANNDRQPGPGEGIANVSVLAVDAQGQRLARGFTNAQGEAIFNLTSETVARVIVPFVPGWSARVRAGEANNDIVLGLPAVRLPIFLPVQNRPNSEE